MVSASMKYAVWIGPATRAGAGGGPRSSVAGDRAKTTRSRGSATLQRLCDLRGCTRSLPLGSAFGSLIRHRAASRCSQQLGFVVRIPSPKARPHPVKPSPTQSNLVKPSQTIIFSSLFSLTPWQTIPSIRLVREIRGSPSKPSLATSHRPLATASPAQYGLIRPNTALIVFGPVRDRSFRHQIMGNSVMLRGFGQFPSFDLPVGGC